MSETKRYRFHFSGAPLDTVTTEFTDEDRERLFGDGAKQYAFVTFWGEHTVIVNMQNVTFVEVLE